MRPWSCIVGLALLIVATGIGSVTRMCWYAVRLSERIFVSAVQDELSRCLVVFDDRGLHVTAALFWAFKTLSWAFKTKSGSLHEKAVLEHENRFTTEAIWIVTRA